jgi:hypothetical protein
VRARGLAAGMVPAGRDGRSTARRLQIRRGRETLISRLTQCWRTRAAQPLIHPERLRPGFPRTTVVRVRDYVAELAGQAQPWTTSSPPRTLVDRATWTKPAPLVQRVVDHIGPLVQHRLDQAAQLVRGGWTNLPDRASPVSRATAVIGPKPLPRCKPLVKPTLRLLAHRRTRLVPTRWNKSDLVMARPVRDLGPERIAGLKQAWSERLDHADLVHGHGGPRGWTNYGWSRSLVQPAQDQRSGAVVRGVRGPRRSSPCPTPSGSLARASDHAAMGPARRVNTSLASTTSRSAGCAHLRVSDPRLSGVVDHT